MTSLLAPACHDLGHDARQVGVHHAGVQGPGWSLGDKVEDGYAKLGHHFPLRDKTADNPAKLHPNGPLRKDFLARTPSRPVS
jgi:hypothetical protein